MEDLAVQFPSEVVDSGELVGPVPFGNERYDLRRLSEGADYDGDDKQIPEFAIELRSPYDSTTLEMNDATQYHAVIVLRNQHLIPEELRSLKIAFQGSRWTTPAWPDGGIAYIPYIYFAGGEWLLDHMDTRLMDRMDSSFRFAYLK